MKTITRSILAILKAKPGKEDELEVFLKSALSLVDKEEGTITWYALKLDDSTFGIFDTFEDEEGLQAHMNGEVAKLLMEKTDELLSEAPDIKEVDILASKS